MLSLLNSHHHATLQARTLLKTKHPRATHADVRLTLQKFLLSRISERTREPKGGGGDFANTFNRYG